MRGLPKTRPGPPIITATGPEAAEERRFFARPIGALALLRYRKGFGSLVNLALVLRKNG